jgi:hypothetical protein
LGTKFGGTLVENRTGSSDRVGLDVPVRRQSPDSGWSDTGPSGHAGQPKSSSYLKERLQLKEMIQAEWTHSPHRDTRAAGDGGRLMSLLAPRRSMRKQQNGPDKKRTKSRRRQGRYVGSFVVHATKQ